MTREELKRLLADRENDELVAEILDRRPWIFAADQEHDLWSSSVAAVLQIGKEDIRIVGSAATGYSLSPYKAGRPFRAIAAGKQASDIDIAIISKEIFEEAWNTIVGVDRKKRLRLSEADRDKMRTDVYWGLVGHRSLPANTGVTRRILIAMAVAGKSPPVRGQKIRCRIYRRCDDLRAYHTVSLQQLRLELDV